jgi:hypothetical protein
MLQGDVDLSYRREADRSYAYRPRLRRIHARSRVVKHRAVLGSLPRWKRGAIERLRRLRPEVEHYDGKTIVVDFGGETLRKEIEVVPHEVWVGSWENPDDKVRIDDDLPEDWRESTALHETLEEHFKEDYGLDPILEGHELAEEMERNWFLRKHSKEEWDAYSRIVDRVHRLELDYLRALGS